MTDNTENNYSEQTDILDEKFAAAKGSFFTLIIPLIAAVLLIYSISKVNTISSEYYNADKQKKDVLFKKHSFSFSALLAAEEFSKSLRDTIYTSDDIWLEMRIDRQMLYVHYRDGREKSYPISSGNKYLSKGVESRSGLFAIFLKEEVHLSSQFNNAQMNYYMPFNMGIGFHGLPGTGYYGNLGIRPSSHGCIRMRNDHVKELFRECKVGTLVLAHYGESARTIAFAPKGFNNEKEYNKDEYMDLMAYNLNSIYEGKYLINPPKRFIVDASIIPRIGYYLGDKNEIAERQIIPKVIVHYPSVNDRIIDFIPEPDNIAGSLPDDIAAKFTGTESKSTDNPADVYITKDLVKKLVYNPRGILPYFPPN